MKLWVNLSRWRPSATVCWSSSDNSGPAQITLVPHPALSISRLCYIFSGDLRWNHFIVGHLWALLLSRRSLNEGWRPLFFVTIIPLLTLENMNDWLLLRSGSCSSTSKLLMFVFCFESGALSSLCFLQCGECLHVCTRSCSLMYFYGNRRLFTC